MDLESQRQTWQLTQEEMKREIEALDKEVSESFYLFICYFLR